jgi:hypothetical protein
MHILIIAHNKDDVWLLSSRPPSRKRQLASAGQQTCQAHIEGETDANDPT